MSLRRSARVAGIHLSTSFRWRHRILGGKRASDCTFLSGLIELEEVWFAYSEKGSRKLSRPARRQSARRKDPLLLSHDRVSVVIALARAGGMWSTLFTTRCAGSLDLKNVLLPRLRAPVELLSRWGSMSPYGLLAHAAGGRHHCAVGSRNSNPAEHHIRNVRMYVLRLHDWLQRFRGVATRYLANYLAWHRCVDLPENAVPLCYLRWRHHGLAIPC
jgi:hypothetical protein